MFERQGLTFREVEPVDLPLLREWRNDPRMQWGWHTPVSVQTPQQEKRWYDTLQGGVHEAYIAMDGEQTVGLLRYRIEGRQGALTGTDVAPDCQNKGYGKRILRAGAEHLLCDLGLHRVTAEHIDGGIGARAIIEAAGFRQEGTYRGYVWRDGQWRDWHIYGLLEGEL